MILQTKLQIPPLRSGLVSRPRLIDRLKAEMDRKLLLISAPAGYGKTTLVAEWLHLSRCKSTWLSLDENDNDPRRFLDYLLAALRQVQPGIGRAVEAMLQSPQQPPGETILTALVNDIVAAAEPFIIVLDDYHVIQAPLIHQQLSFLLERQPSQMRMVVITREDPLLPLPRLRARGQLSEIRQEDLRFSPEECADFLRRVMGLDLSPADVAALEHRTEGWIAGLHLAALSMRGHSDVPGFIRAFTGSSRFILDYLMDEVFEQQTPEMKDFLLRTSILETLCAPLCNAVTERLNGQDKLFALEQANLFTIPLDQSRTWYRYHRLFAEILQHRLRTSQHSIEAELHRRASRWFQAEGLTSEAIHHALSAPDWELAARLIGEAAEGLLKRGELITVVGWCRQLPGELVLSRPALGMAYAWALLLLGRFDEAEGLLAEFEQVGYSAPVLLGQVAAAQAYAARARGDQQRVIEKSEQSLSLLPESDLNSRSTLFLNLGLVYWHTGQLQEAAPAFNQVLAIALKTGNEYAGLTARIFLARTLVSQGRLREPEEMLNRILEIGGQNPILALAHYDLAGIYYEWNEPAKAWNHVERGLEISVRSGNAEFQNGGHMQKIPLLVAQGDMLKARAEAVAAHSLSEAFGPATRARGAACHAQVALAMHDVPSAEQWCEQILEDVDLNSFHRFLGLTKARLLVAQGRKLAARELLEERLVRAEQAGWGFAIVAIRALLAQVADSEETGLRILAQGLRSSRLEGFIRSYVDAGSGLIPLLEEAAHRGILPDYVKDILHAYRGAGKAVPGLAEPLSGRELEVLRLISAGLSNREIAGKLVISLGTAKTHVHNLCGKLGVRNRTEAAIRAKELELV